LVILPSRQLHRRPLLGVRLLRRLVCRSLRKTGPSAQGEAEKPTLRLQDRAWHIFPSIGREVGGGWRCRRSRATRFNLSLLRQFDAVATNETRMKHRKNPCSIRVSSVARLGGEQAFILLPSRRSLRPKAPGH